MCYLTLGLLLVVLVVTSIVMRDELPWRRIFLAILGIAHLPSLLYFLYFLLGIVLKGLGARGNPIDLAGISGHPRPGSSPPESAVWGHFLAGAVISLFFLVQGILLLIAAFSPGGPRRLRFWNLVQTVLCTLAAGMVLASVVAGAGPSEKWDIALIGGGMLIAYLGCHLAALLLPREREIPWDRLG